VTADPPRIGSADWWFRDRATGERVIAQPPNAPILVVIAATLVSRLAPSGPVRRVAGVVATVVLAYWSIDEMARGVNPWRRLLGAVGAVADVRRLVDLLHLLRR